MYNIIVPFGNYSSPIAMSKTNVKGDNVNESTTPP